MLLLSVYSALLVAATPLSPATQSVRTDRHDPEVRLARPGDEGLLRYGAPESVWPSHAGPEKRLREDLDRDSQPFGTARGIAYDVATGTETRMDLPDIQDLSRWVPGRVLNDDGSSEPLFGWDSDMSAISSQSFPWSTQVRIKGQDAFGTPFEVSGTLIDARHVITAGHCVHAGAGGTWHNSIYVYPAWDGDSDAFGSAFATSYATFTGWTNSSDPAEDVGFLRLDRPLGFMTGWLGYGFDSNDSFYTSNYFNLAGYPDAASCYTGAPDQLFYGFGLYDSVTSGLLHANAAWSCDAQGADGGGAYSILGGQRFVYAVHRLHDTTAAYDIEQTRLTSTHLGFYENTFRPGSYSSTDPDYVPLDVQVDMGGPAVLAGDALVSMDYLVGNASLFDPVGTQTHLVEVYLSTNDNISTFDTLIQTHTYDYDYEALGSQRIQVAVPPTIPADTPSGTYWIGVITKSYDADSGNNDTDGRDAFPIVVQGCDADFTPFGVGLPGSGGFAPLLYGLGDSCQAAGHSIDLAGALGGARGTLWLGLGTADLYPVFGGHFYIDITQPYWTFGVRAGGAAGVPGVGTFHLPGGDIREFVGLTLYLQVSLLDPGAIKGISLSNAVSLEIKP